MRGAKTAAAAAALGTASYLTYQAISEEIFKKFFLRKDRQDIVEQKYLDWISASNVSKVTVESFDGLKLDAYDIANHDSDRYIIMVHGIFSAKASNYPRAYEFDQLGYNILLIDQRSAGDSEGAYYTYGFKEAQDLTIWIDYLRKKNEQMKIALYGLSMGAATVMLASAYDLPGVRCIIEDCGYSSAKEEFDHLIKTNYKLSRTAPILKIVEKKMKDHFGMSFADISPKKCLEENEIPIVFVHGKEDQTVPFKMATILYNHNKGEKKYYPLENAGHCQASDDPDYYRNLDNFIRNCFDR